MVCFIEKTYSFRFFKGCYPQVLLGRFLNTLTHIIGTSPYKNYQYVTDNLLAVRNCAPIE